ncbi:GNAT family N-acetyltransferase [Litoreibacter sp.]|nr:GNAT family N-acetyltransferase [Litoreibacter sp.]
MTPRLASKGDHAAIWAILEPVFRAGTTYAVARDISKEDALAMWCEAPAATYVVEENGVLLGTYYIKTNAQGGGSHVCNCGYITAIQARGKGVARLMCEHSQSEARGLGYSAMQFNLVLASNLYAVKLWHALDYKTVGVLPKVFDHPKHGLVDALVMYKALAD